MRSRKYGTQPMPPSESANFRFGNFFIAGDHTRSAAACTMFIGDSVISTSIGASGAVIDDLRRRPDVQADDRAELLGACAPERVPVGRHVEARVAELRRVLRERDRVAALGRRRARTSAAMSSGSQSGGDRERDEAPRVGARTSSSMCQSLYACTQREREVGVVLGGAGEQLPAELRERREAHRAEDAVGVHVLDALVDVVAAGPHARRTTSGRCRTPPGDARRPR